MDYFLKLGSILHMQFIHLTFEHIFPRKVSISDYIYMRVKVGGLGLAWGKEPKRALSQGDKRPF